MQCLVFQKIKDRRKEEKESLAGEKESMERKEGKFRQKVSET